jgi:hypothetical protein
VAVATGTNPAMVTDPFLGTIWVAYHNGTKFVIERFHNLVDFINGDSDGPYDIVTTDAVVAGLEIGLSAERWLVFVYEDNSGEIQRLFSNNGGQTWGG